MISPARRRIVYNAIKNAILKGQEVEYWALRMYDQLEAGVLTDEQVAELEVLVDEYYIAELEVLTDEYYNPPEPEPEPIAYVDESEPEETSTVADSEPESVDDSELPTDTESEE